jgi:hypothetical protein
MLSLTSFRATARRVTPDQAAQEVGDAFFDDFDAAAVWLYDGLCFICEMPDGSFWVPVERDDMSGTREECEVFLYVQHYVHQF